MVLGNLQKFYELRIGTTERKVKIIRAVSVTVWTSLLRKVIFILYLQKREWQKENISLPSSSCLMSESALWLFTILKKFPENLVGK